jgi:hypothetical protein
MRKKTLRQTRRTKKERDKPKKIHMLLMQVVSHGMAENLRCKNKYAGDGRGWETQEVECRERWLWNFKSGTTIWP